MRVATWNVQTARPNPDGPADIDGAAAFVRALDADVVALQELDRGSARTGRVDQPRVMAEVVGGTLVWAPAVRSDGEYGVALIVRGEVVRSHELALGGVREPRVLLVAEVDHDGRRWTIGCTHLSRHRRCATGQLQAVLDELARRPAPRVLLGDLNLTPRHVLPWSTAEGYHLVDGPPTHSTRKPHPTDRIDHILVAGARVTKAAVHDFAYSDHRAVAATLA